MLSTPSRRLAGFALDVLLFFVTLGIGWLVWSWFEWDRGRTPGKRLVGTTVIDTDGESLGRRGMARRALVKGVALMAGLLTLGVLWWLAAAPVLWRGRRTTWDRVAHTNVRGHEVERSRVRTVMGRAGAGVGFASIAMASLLMVGIWVPTAATMVGNLVSGEGNDRASGRPTEERCAELRPGGRVPTEGHADDDAALRVFAIGYHLRIDDARDYSTYRDRMRCLMEDEVVPNMIPGRPTLVVFPEDVGLPAIALGGRGVGPFVRRPKTPARAVSAAAPLGMGAALGQLNLAYAPQIAAYQAKFGPIDPRKQAMLAATDTFARLFMRTFSDIARDYGVFVVASNNMAEYEVTTNKAKVALFADPEAQPTGHAYVATSARVTNSTFLWAPDVVDASAPDFTENLMILATRRSP